MKRTLTIGVPAILFAFAIAGCHSDPNAAQNQDQSQNATQPAQDPATANLANASNTTESPTDQTPPAASASPSESYDQSSSPQDNGAYSDSDYSADEVAPDPPPALPDYDQPPAPGDNYIWSPGYWSWASQGYYWVPGAWVMAPYVGALWTPGYWDADNGRYRWHDGYWGRHVGYYGGVNYGYGYDGNGYEGGYWRDTNFYYNRDVDHVDPAVHNVYNYRVQNTYNNSRVSYDGGRGGLNFRPTPAQMAATHEQHIAALPVQQELRQSSQNNRAQFAKVNQGRPQMLAENRPVNGGRAAPAPRAEDFHAAATPNRPAPVPPAHGVPARPGQPPMSGGRRPEAAAPNRAPAPNAAARNVPESRRPAPAQPRSESHPVPQPKPVPRPASRPEPKSRTGSHPARNNNQHPQAKDRQNDQHPQ